MSERIIAAGNRKSTNGDKFQRQVFEPLVRYAGRKNVVPYEINKPVNETIAEFSELINDGDTVIACGGDGTVSAIASACMESEAPHTLGIIGLGRANDAAVDITGKSIDPLRLLSAPIAEVRPMELRVDGEHAAYALQHIMAAQAAQLRLYLNVKAREKHGDKRYASVISGLPQFLEYFKKARQNPDGSFPVPFLWNGQESDANCIGFTLGRLAGTWNPGVVASDGSKLHISEHEFAAGSARIEGRFRDLGRIAQWAALAPPFHRTNSERIEFLEPQTTTLVVDGEAVELTDATELTVARAEKPLKMLAPQLLK